MPDLAAQPLREEHLLAGPLEPTNLYGPGDKYNPENIHVIPAQGLARSDHDS